MHRQVPKLSEKERALLDQASEGDAGTKEALLLSHGDSAEELERKSRKNEHARNENFRDHFEKLSIASLYIAVIGTLGIAGAWIWHVATPNSWHWLSADQIDTLKSLVTGGILAGVASGHIRKRLQ